MVVLADTGTGKTAVLQSIAQHSYPLPTLLFELELPDTLMFERFMQMVHGKTGQEIYHQAKSSAVPSHAALDHIYTCSKSKMDTVEMERIINEAELKIGERPVVIGVDYIGLLSGMGRSRYERISDSIEQLKVLAKATNTIVIVASQVHRKGQNDEDPEVFLHDAKDSGSVENSAGLVVGGWRDKLDGSVLHLKVLKNTKGKSGLVVHCNFFGERMHISEKSKIDDADIPPPLPPVPEHVNED